MRISLDPSQLRGRITPDALPAATGDIEPLAAITGQDRAAEAIEFGLSIQAEGYNIAVIGTPGSGRNALVRTLVEAAATRGRPADDWCYLHNFNDPYRPIARALPGGLGDDLQRELARLAQVCRQELPQSFMEEAYQARLRAALEPIDQQRQREIVELQGSAAHLGFLVGMTPMGFMAQPASQDGRPLSPEVAASLSGSEREALEERGRSVSRLIDDATKRWRELDRQARAAVRQLEQEVTRFIVGGILDDLRERFGNYGLEAHFDAIEADIVENLEEYKRFGEVDLGQLPPQHAAEIAQSREQLLSRYAVNLLVTHGDEPGATAPVVFEPNPSPHNLFGHIDYVAHQGSLSTDFTKIRPGALHMANSGYLVLQLEDLLRDPRSWLRLKHALKTHEIRVQDNGDALPAVPMVGLVPASIPLRVKVVLIGRPWTVAMLDVVDDEFNELFKLRAQFDPDVEQDEAMLLAYAGFVRRTVGDADLLPFDARALEEIVHYGNRLAGRNDRLTMRFGELADICHEANEVARRAGSPGVQGEHVREAIRARTRRSALVPDRLRRMIAEGTLHIATSGAAVGQVNGLAVYQVGGAEFGVPTRITCRTGLGRRGIVAIEREVERSGAIHSKGVLVLAGYLTGTFGRERQLAFTASLTFEQSYSEVEGDSASSAELCAILTSLADIPIRQDVAVTGSVDQLGRIQAVGGVTQKIEGFFDVCNDIGLTGEQGVVIPRQNIVNLTLDTRVIEAVERGEFHVWAAERIEEVLELLTGIDAGALVSGAYPDGTIFRRVADALDHMERRAIPADAAPHSSAEETHRRLAQSAETGS